MDKKTIPLTIAALAIAFTIATSSHAVEFNNDGRNIDIFWKQKDDELRAWGVVEDGRDCKQLNLSIFMRNSKDAHIAHVETTIRPYRSHTRNTFKGTDTVYVDDDYRKNWHIDEIYTKCF